MIFITNNQTTVVLEPGKQSLYLPPSSKSSQGSAILRGRLSPVIFMRSNQIDTTFFGQLSIQLITVIRSITNYFFRDMFQKTGIQSGLYQLNFMRPSTGCTNGDRKTKSVCEAHNFGAFAPFGFTHTIAPFFAGAKVPSIKPSLRSMPPRSLRSWASAVKILAKTPNSLHSWKRRWQVLLGGYRSGISDHWAPVRNIQRMPLSTARQSCGGRPDFPGWALGFGIYSAIRCHCSLVRSIMHNIGSYIVVPEKFISIYTEKSCSYFGGLYNARNEWNCFQNLAKRNDL